MSEHDYCVYMLTNQSHRVLYTGVTNNLVRTLPVYASLLANGRDHREPDGDHMAHADP
jgi:hypothetical protein